MSRTSSRKGGRAPVIIKREEIVEGGHHGGAWKVAYADFVTAMMAFFLLMWLLNATTEEQRRGLADYFAAQGQMAQSTSGSGAPFGGRTPFDHGSLVSDRGALSVVPGKATQQPDAQDQDEDAAPAAPSRSVAHGSSEDAAEQADPPSVSTAVDPALASRMAADDAAKRLRAEIARQERADFEKAAEQIREAIRLEPALADLGHQLAIDMTPEGLRIQLLDEEKQPMFASGSAVLNDRARLALQKVAIVLARLSEGISVAGHTDAAPYHAGDRSNWELSSERANATRRLLVENGLQEARFRSVTGHADRDLLLPADPLAAANRRISIVVLRAAASPAAVSGDAPAPPARLLP